MAKHKITLLPGDGIGPEVTASVVAILECAGVDVEWEKYFVGSEAISRFGDPLPQEVLDSILRNKVALKGPVTTPIGTGFSSINVRLRKTLDLYANLRPVRSMPNIKTRYDDIDLIVVRENTEDLYSGLEHEVVPGVVESLKIITKRASTRIAEFAFEYARTHGRKRVTAVHKANIMKMSDGLFLQCFRDVSKDYPNIEADDRIIDNLCMQLVVNPNQFDVLLLENLYGDIVSDLTAGLVGGLGVVAGANIGESGAVFEAVHGSAPDIAGQNKANPLALLQSAVLMLYHIGEPGPAKRVHDAITVVLGSGPEHRTHDIGGSGNTSDFTAAMCETLRRGTRATD
ncbi:MAG TPA: isocitrate dehydrogenase (NAD(+)) [Thermoanaerobaculia bacterium]|jgi:isocitrate dehydrogenase (NAD+)|nr:isocitrate dehydrogenase (NAD(+)) [Thermoanaerobaculia bacterium]